MMEFKAIAECYGKEYNKWKRCKECAARKWCRHAGDPAPVFNQGHIKDSQNSIYEEKLPGDELDLNAPEYSRQDMLEVIVLMMSLDLQTLEMLEQKINNPDISFAKMGRRKNITRQAVHKFITKKCLEVPELETIFRNRRKKAGINKLAA